MIRNYFKIAWRNLVKNKVASFINIGGLAVGMAVAMLIGLWILDELSFNKNHKNYDRIAKVMENGTSNGEIATDYYIPFRVGDELRGKFGSNFKHVVMATNTDVHVLNFDDKKLKQQGNFMGSEAPELLGLKMIRGSYGGFKDPETIMLSASAARAFFGNSDPINKVIIIDNGRMKITGVYENIPHSSEFKDLAFIANLPAAGWNVTEKNQWRLDDWHTYVQMADNADLAQVSKKIKNIKQDHLGPEDKVNHWELFLDPMSKWHLNDSFRSGIRSGGPIVYVQLFGLIGVFVLLLACINFMNLSTARSEKRAKEVGIRKAIGSARRQLIYQFFIESFLVVFFAFLFSLILVQLALPLFNQVAGKTITILWHNPLFWTTDLCFCLFSGLVAGSYPAFYLSSFKPIKVLKGTFKAGTMAALPRKVLVVVQFSVSIILIIGTIVIFRQVQFAKDRPVGYDRNGLIMSEIFSPIIGRSFDAIRQELKNSGAVTGVAESSSPTDDLYFSDGDFNWPGKAPGAAVTFSTIRVTEDYGKAMGWKFTDGRDFSPAFKTDTAAFVVNEAAVKAMGLKSPIGETVKWAGHSFKIIGVIKDVIMDSPYEPVIGSVFFFSHKPSSFVIIKLNPLKGVRESLSKITAIFRKYDPSVPFEYRFADEAYAQKFGNEERIGKLASCFTILAVFISCLGLFGMASFMAEQRVKEIGVRKVLGASVFNLWRLLTKDFVVLVGISLLIATPVSYYLMYNWLQHYTYRSTLTWWIFGVTGLAAILITLLTVSYQSVKAALANPVKSLKTE